MTSQIEAISVEPPVPADPLQHLLDVPVRTEAVLGELQMTLRAITALKVGDVLRTHRPVSEPLDLRVNSGVIAAAEVCLQSEKLGLRLVEMRLEK